MNTKLTAKNAPASVAGGKLSDEGQLWLLTLQAENKRPKTISTYSEGLRALEGFLGHPAVDVTKLELKQWLVAMQTTLSPGSISVRWRSVKRFFVFLVTDEIRQDNPTSTVPNPKVPEKLFDSPSRSQVEAMLADCDLRTRVGKRDAAIIAVLMDTGARRGEVAALKREHIDFQNGTITIHTSKTAARTLLFQEPGQTMKHLKRWMMEPRRTFNDNLWDVNGADDLVRRVVPRHSGDVWTTHSIRRYAVVKYHLDGGSEVGMKYQFGWTRNSQMASLYAHGWNEEINHEEVRRMRRNG